MVIPVKYRKSSEQLVNYNWVDVADGTGYITFYGFASKIQYENHTTEVFHMLGTNLTYSYPLSTSFGIPQAGGPSYDVYVGEINFKSSTFNSPRVLKGKAIAVIPTEENNNVTGNGGYHIYWKVYKVSSSGTETLIGAARGAGFSSGAAGTSRNCSVIFINFNSKVLFGKGDYIKCKLEMWGVVAPSQGTLTASILHDPMDTTTILNNVHSQLIFYIPFEINS